MQSMKQFSWVFDACIMSLCLAGNLEEGEYVVYWQHSFIELIIE